MVAYPLAVDTAGGRRAHLRRRLDVARLAVVAGALVLLAGCRVGVSVEVEAGTGGAGHVRATVTLDREAAAQVPDLARQLRVDDLEAAGWEVDGPRPAPGGGVRVRASKPFASAAGAALALEELAGGPPGPVSSLRLEVDRGAWKTRTSLKGTVDLSRGLAVLGDQELAERLGGPTLGLDPAAVERDLGRRLDEVFVFELVGDLPGRVTSNAPTRRDGAAAWPAPLGGTVSVQASSEAWNPLNVALGVLALVSGLALVAVLVRRSRAVSWG